MSLRSYFFNQKSVINDKLTTIFKFTRNNMIVLIILNLTLVFKSLNLVNLLIQLIPGYK